jgi:hypothetical protein
LPLHERQRIAGTFFRESRGPRPTGTSVVL